MNKVNIANYVVYDLANRFSVSEQNNDVVELIAEDWHKKHFITVQDRGVKFRCNKKISQKFII